MKAKDLERFRDHLIAERNRVQRLAARHAKAIQHADNEAEGHAGKAHSNHMADLGSDEFQYETMIHLVGSESEYLYEIEEALGRIEDGTFGTCQDGDHPIALPRLEAVPTARLCIQCQEQQEKRPA